MPGSGINAVVKHMDASSACLPVGCSDVSLVVTDENSSRILRTDGSNFAWVFDIDWVCHSRHYPDLDVQKEFRKGGGKIEQTGMNGHCPA